MRKWISLLLIALLAFNLAACSAPSESAPADGDGNSGGAVPADSSAQTEQVTITFMAQAGSPPCMYTLIDQFEEENPGIKVEVNEVAANDTYDQLVLQTEANAAPDVFMTFWTIDAATNGLAAELDAFMDMEEFDRRFTEAGQGYGEWEGHIYAIPYRSGCSVMFANATLFEQAGIALPYDGWTWEQFYAIAQELTDAQKGVYGYSICGDFSDTGTEWQFQSLLLQAGCQLIDENNKAAFNTEGGVAAFTFIKSMMDAGIIPPSIASTNVDQQGELMASGKLALFSDGPWFQSTIQEKAGDNYEIVALPMPTGVTSGSLAGGTALGMSSKSQNKEAAWRFIAFMTSDGSLNYWCEEFGQVSPLREAGDSDYFQTDDYKIKQQQLLDPGTIVANHYPDSSALNAIMRGYIQAVYLGEMEPKAALDAAAQEWNAILDEYYTE